MPRNTRPLKIGQFEIPSPCTVPWDEMDPHGARNRVCRQCDKVVHDLTGMSEAEIDAIFERNGGSLCASFSLDALGNPIYIKSPSQPRKPRFLKHLAAAASLALLYQTPMAQNCMPRTAQTSVAPSSQQPIDPRAKRSPVETGTNTLVEGMIVDQNNFVIADPLRIDFWVHGKRFCTMHSSPGYFKHDFVGELLPSDKIKIEVIGNEFDADEQYNRRRYSGTVVETTVGEATFVTLRVNYTPPPRSGDKTGGIMYKPGN